MKKKYLSLLISTRVALSVDTVHFRLTHEYLDDGLDRSMGDKPAPCLGSHVGRCHRMETEGRGLNTIINASMDRGGKRLVIDRDSMAMFMKLLGCTEFILCWNTHLLSFILQGSNSYSPWVQSIFSSQPKNFTKANSSPSQISTLQWGKWWVRNMQVTYK